jgi:putative transport protein
MLEPLAALLHRYPELCLFASVLLGHLIGRVHVMGVGFGSVVGTLIAGIIIGIFARPDLPDLLRWAFFYLFLFAIGYSVGPQFFGSLKKSALPQIALAVIVAFTGLATTILMTVTFGFDEGIAVGILSGGMTQSAALGTGLNAIAELPLPNDVKATLAANAPLADAITYGFGDLGLILFLTWLGPKMLRADLKAEAAELEKTLAGGMQGVEVFPSGAGYRAYRVDNAALAGTTVAALEGRFAAHRLAVQRISRDGRHLSIEPGLLLSVGDHIVVSAGRAALTASEREIGAEIDEAELLSVPMKQSSLVVTSAAVMGKTLAELGTDRRVRGVYLQSLQRGTQLMPREPWTVIERGDILHVIGSPDDVERAGQLAGFVERDLARTDLAFLAAGICAGILLGLLKAEVAGLRLGLGTSGSILVVGLIAGWARSRYPVFGSIPEPAQRLLIDIGLIVFIAVVGLHAGPHAVEAYRESGGAFFGRILAAGMVVTVMPLAVGTIAARLVFKMSPLMILGGLAGAQTCTPGLNALREASGSNVGALAYTVPYAIGNILLTLWGPVVVAIVHAMRP